MDINKFFDLPLFWDKYLAIINILLLILDYIIRVKFQISLMLDISVWLP